MKKNTFLSSKKAILLIGIAVTLVASIPLFMQGLWQNGTGHDMFFHLMRIEGLSEGLASGTFPVRIQPGWYNGYGYATSVFYGDLFLYIPALLYLAGLPLEVSYKIFLILCNGATFFVAYFSLKGIFKKNVQSLIGASWYTLSLYRMIDVYIRHAVGEHAAMIFLPLVGFAMYSLLKEDPDTAKGWRALTIGISGILLSHIISLEICVGILVVICLIFVKRIFRKETLLACLKAVGVTVLINLWFLVPFMDYMKNGTFNANTISEYKKSINIQESGLLLRQLFGLSYHAGGVNLTISEGIENEMPLGVGVCALIILLAALVILLCHSHLKRKAVSEAASEDRSVSDQVFKEPAEENITVRFMIILLAGSILSLWMSTYYFPWEAISSIHKAFRYAIVNIQFPWRFLGFASAFLAFLLTAVLCSIGSLENPSSSDQKDKQRCGIANIPAFAALLALIFAALAVSDISMLHDETRVSTKVSIRTVDDLDTSLQSGEEYLPYGTVVSELTDDIITEGAEITSYEKNGLSANFTCENSSSSDGYIELPLLYYRGYHAISNVDGRETEMTIVSGDNNRILIVIPAGFTGSVSVIFRSPLLWRIAEIISLLTLILALGAGVSGSFFGPRCRG